MDISEFMGTPNSEKNGLQVDLLDTTVAEQQIDDALDVTETAEQVWLSGRAFLYLYKACERMHVGDQRIIKILLLSFAATRIANSYGMHVTVSGDAGTGKSHVVDTVKRFLPPASVKSGRMSDKALFHHRFDPGCVVILDDQSPSDDLQELVKESTTDFHAETTYYSVRNGSPVVLTIAAETVFWMVKAEIVGDEQIQDRMFNMHTDSSTEQLDAIRRSIVDAARDPRQAVEDHTVEDVARRIWSIMPRAYVAIPWADRVDTEERPAARNLNLFYDLVRASALFHAPVRPRDGTIGDVPVVVATYHDFLVAAKLMNPLMGNIGGSQKNGTDTTQQMILDYLGSRYQDWTANDPIPAKVIRSALTIGGSTMTYALRGRNGRPSEGLCNICPAIDATDMIVPNDNGRGVHRETGIIWDYNAYVRWNGGSGGFFIRDADLRPVYASYAAEGAEVREDGSGEYDHRCRSESVEIADIERDAAVERERVENTKRTHGAKI